MADQTIEHELFPMYNDQILAERALGTLEDLRRIPMSLKITRSNADIYGPQADRYFRAFLERAENNSTIGRAILEFVAEEPEGTTAEVLDFWKRMNLLKIIATAVDLEAKRERAAKFAAQAEAKRLKGIANQKAKK